MSEYVEFEDALDSNDWGLIIGDDGSLKGLFIPEGKEDEEIPDVIVELCIRFFGVDPTTEEKTVH